MNGEQTTPTAGMVERADDCRSGSIVCSLPSLFYGKDGITIYHGKCEQVLPFLEPVDLVLTDPPYGIGEANGKPKQRTKPFGSQIKTNNPRGTTIEARDYLQDTWDDKPPDDWLLREAIAKGQHAIVWGGNHLGLAGGSCWLVWDKDNSGDFADCELAWTNLQKAVRKFKWRWNGMLQERMGDKKEQRWHPTQKPLAVMRWAINQAPDDVATILDPFMGSGTTLVAAKLEGKQAIGIEREKRYCEIAAERLRQGVLF